MYNHYYQEYIIEYIIYSCYYLLNNTYEMVQIGMLCWHNDTNCTVNNIIIIYSVLLAIMYPAGLCVCAMICMLRLLKAATYL